MKIVSVTPIVCDAGWRPWIFIRITASDGTVGYGECSDNRSPHAVLGAIEDFRELIVGRDPRHIEMLYWDMYRATRHSVGGVVQKAIAGINCALLDLQAKSLNVPVFQLFGGPTRDDIRVYWTHLGSYRIQHGTHLGTPEVRSMEDIAELAGLAKSRGFGCAKINAIDVFASPPKVISQGFGGAGGSTDRIATSAAIRSLKSLVELLRDSVGDEFDIAIDLNFNFTPEGVIRIAEALEPHHLAWIETDSFD
ncbi:MAG: mandelate racemase/muconate lactonizing enzyme family protein, partial [Gammaproteobacteria bacterium]|nr:mandelate racemase/muconate lactonizing enzyme family protein [Gammaproteobacteria bacterium]